MFLSEFLLHFITFWNCRLKLFANMVYLIPKMCNTHRHVKLEMDKECMVWLALHSEDKYMRYMCTYGIRDLVQEYQTVYWPYFDIYLLTLVPLCTPLVIYNYANFKLRPTFRFKLFTKNIIFFIFNHLTHTIDGYRHLLL